MELEKVMQELIDNLGDNVASITYDADLKQWIIRYKNKLPTDTLPTDVCADFLING